MLRRKFSEYIEKVRQHQEQRRTTENQADSFNQIQPPLPMIPHHIQTPPNGRFLWPIQGGRGRVTSGFGWRANPFNKTRMSHHNGLDFGGGLRGVNIIAIAPGKVVDARNMGSFGNTVVIEHANKIWTLYAHNERNLVTRGMNVVAGTPIATVGSTGASTGPHLHLEVRVGKNHRNNAQNPNNFISRPGTS